MNPRRRRTSYQGDAQSSTSYRIQIKAQFVETYEDINMNLVQQHEEVVKEIEKYYDFVLRISLRNFVRMYFPNNLYKLVRLQLGLIARILLKDETQSLLDMRRGILDVLCNDKEKASPFYRIVYSDLYPIHAQSKHLEKKFPKFHWPSLEQTSQLRMDMIPTVRLMSIVHLLMLVLTAMGVLNSVDSIDWLANNSDGFWMLIVFVGVFYFLIVFCAFAWAFVVTRQRLKRTMNILTYMRIRRLYHAA